MIALVAGIPGACCLATITGIVLLASRGDPTSATLNTLAATFGGWFVGGGAFLLLHETGGQ